MSGRNCQRYGQHSDYTFNSPEDFTRSSLLQRMDPPAVKPWAFPSFLQAGQPPKPLEYFHRTPELEAKRRADTATLSSRCISSPRHLLLAPNEQECVYKAIAWENCFGRRKLGEQDVVHKGILHP
ncbi:hypothetical protein EAF04_000552 [Stromatinia cepivora]|nr:hypothetical protein EAF04_000552 [Stromatinia cepivora]